MSKQTILTTMLVGWLAVASAQAASTGTTVVPSAHDVATTADRLETALRDSGATVFARIDHAAGAAQVQQTLQPTQLIIFGNPKLGTALLQSAREIGIDLPLKMLVWEDDQGKVWLSYNNPEYLAERHGIEDRAPQFQAMGAALTKLAAAATEQN